MSGLKIRIALRHFLRSRAGNFAVIASLLAVPLLLGAGIALDLSTITRVKSDLQQSLDAAALAVARKGTNISNREATEIAASFLTGNYEADYSDLKMVRDGTSVKLTATVGAGIAFGGLFGYDDVPVTVSSSADMAFTRYEIGLVLDTTGSMEGGKLRAMKDAVLGLIDDLSSQVSDPERLKFAMVPFATFVNVGPQYGPSFDERGRVVPDTGAEWLDIEGKSEIPQLELQPGISRFEVFHRLGKEWGGCVETRQPSKKGAHDVADTPATPGDRASYFIPAFAIDEPDERGYRNSYIASKVDPLDNSPLARVQKLLKYRLDDLLAELGLGGVAGGLLGGPGPTDYTGGKGPNNGCDTHPITPLTSDYNELKRKVEALRASGTTNIMEGVAWGMRVLSPHEPFSQGREETAGVEKIMIVLTDGANNFGNKSNKLGSSYSSFGYLVDGRLGTTGGAQSTNRAMNDKTLEACENAKKDGIEVYTIRLEEPDVKTGMMLKDCASGADHFFDAPSRSQLDEVFGGIRDSIIRLRLSS